MLPHHNSRRAAAAGLPKQGFPTAATWMPPAQTGCQPGPADESRARPPAGGGGRAGAQASEVQGEPGPGRQARTRSLAAHAARASRFLGGPTPAAASGFRQPNYTRLTAAMGRGGGGRARLRPPSCGRRTTTTASADPASRPRRPRRRRRLR